MMCPDPPRRDAHNHPPFPPTKLVGAPPVENNNSCGNGEKAPVTAVARLLRPKNELAPSNTPQVLAATWFFPLPPFFFVGCQAIFFRAQEFLTY